MLKLTNLTIKNFLSIGNVTQAINLNQEEIVLVLGENLDLGGEDQGARNGVGKSACMNAVSYALYGWAISDIKKENLVNKSNGKNMLVTLDFESNNKNYRIVRGRKPNFLEFYENGIKQNTDKSLNEVVESEDSAQGDSRETQREIEKVIGMSMDMFCQIVAVNTYTQPFLFQKIADQRTLIEQLLGITLLSEKAEKLKEDIKTVRETQIKEDLRVKSVDAANKRIQKQIDGLVEKQVHWQKQKNKELTLLNGKIQKLSQIDIDLELANHAAWDVYNAAERGRINFAQQYDSLQNTLSKEQRILESLADDLISLEQQCCQTCKQKIKTSTHKELFKELKTKEKESKREITEIEAAIKVVEEELLAIPTLEKPDSKNYNTVTEAHDHRNKLMLLTQEYQQVEKEVDPYQDQIDSMRGSALEEIDLSYINELSRFIDHQEFLLKLLTNKDSFIRKKIIEQNLNYLNVRLSYYLGALGLPHEVVFQNDLSVNITELGRDLSFGNLSRGESGRLSFSLSMAFRDVFENLYQKINLLMLDEILDNGLDHSGSEAATKILRDMSRDRGKSVWLISHKDEMLSKCDSVCKVIKENGFTKFNFDESS